MTVSLDDTFLRRSTLIIPANKQKFIDKALDREADAVQLDLEDGVAVPEKEQARKNLDESIQFLSQGDVEVLVRINDHIKDVEYDLDAAINKGLNGVVIPKVEDAETVKNIESIVNGLERKRNIENGSIHFTILIETAKGFMNIKDIIASSSRLVAVNLGTEDFTLDIGIEPSKTGQELLFPKLYTLIAAQAAELQPLGLIGSMADYRDLNNLYQIARQSYLYGHVGASCIHPSQVPILNKAFSPAQEEVEHAEKVIEVFERAKNLGEGAISMNGKMVDLPVAQRAYNRVAKYKLIKSKGEDVGLTFKN